jgi:hypothetical protein
MFVQIISGKCTDPAGMKKQNDRWEEELKPGAEGFLGATGGVTPDGTFIMAARFESEEAAQKNSDRPEQGAWWSETEQYLEDVSFTNSSDANEWGPGGGGSDDAGFVQIMRGRTKDRKKMEEVDQQFEGEMTKVRPDVIGAYRIWDTSDSYTDLIYFTSEAEARVGEKKEMPEHLKKAFEESMSLVEDIKFYDLPEPWLSSK